MRTKRALAYKISDEIFLELLRHKFGDQVVKEGVVARVIYNPDRGITRVIVYTDEGYEIPEGGEVPDIDLHVTRV